MTRDALAVLVVRQLRAVRDLDAEPHLESLIVDDLGFDSLSVLELVAAVEDELDITVPLNALYDVRTVGEMVDFVARLRAEAP